MDLKRFTVTDECISCVACVGVAEDIFQMGEDGKAFVVKQPENLQEVELAEQALEACPVGAIVELESSGEDLSQKKPVTASDNVKEILDQYPELKNVLLNLSPKFKRLQNPVMYNTLARYVTFKDAAKITGVSVCEILHTINNYLGTAQLLYNSMPECIETQQEIEDRGEPLTWEESNERYIMTEANQEELVNKIMDLAPGENIVIISVGEPTIAIKAARAKDFKYNIEKNREWRLSVFNPHKGEQGPWQQRKQDFDVLDVRGMSTDPFDVIMKKAYSLSPGEGFVLVQSFEPFPIIKMLSEMGFDHETEHVSPYEVRIYFYRKQDEKEDQPLITTPHKPEIVLQSATPVVYPVIMRLLQSRRLRSAISIKELKVWEETEKHLGWIVNGKADVSFSALITSSKLKDLDVRFKALVVWDNFVILTRGYKAQSFADLRGHDIYLPLFDEAPPAKITRYLMKALGYNPQDFVFRYGKPFGRPEKIYTDLVLGKIDTAVLREPEASFAIKIMQDQGVEFSELRYDDMWNQANPGFGNFPNAGVVIKGGFLRKYPDVAELILDEIRQAAQWVVENKDEAAAVSFDIMRQPVDRVRLFLDRVKYIYQDGEPMRSKVKQYFDILRREQILQVSVDEQFLSMFG